MAVHFNFKNACLVGHGGDSTPVSKFRAVCMAQSLKDNLDHRGFQALREALPEGWTGGVASPRQNPSCPEAGPELARWARTRPPGEGRRNAPCAFYLWPFGCPLFDLAECKIGPHEGGGGVLGVGRTGGVASPRQNPSSPETGAELARGCALVAVVVDRTIIEACCFDDLPGRNILNTKMTDVLFAAAHILVFDLPVDEKRHEPRVESLHQFSSRLAVLSKGA